MNRFHSKQLAVFLLVALCVFCVPAYAQESPAEASAGYRHEFSFAYGINGENVQDVGGVRTISPEGFSCGPYLDLLPGTYQVTVAGENLTGMTYDVVSDSGDVAYVIYTQSHTATGLTFGFTLAEATSRMEVRFFNRGQESVTLASCVLEEVSLTDLMQFSVAFGDGQYLQNGEDKEGVRHLYEEGLSYGPYLSLIPGVYEVTITGTNLHWALPRFTNQYGAVDYTLYNLQTTPTQLRYRIQAEELVQVAEVILYNPTPELMTIEGITIKLQ